jgi:hypothetical protein
MLLKFLNRIVMRERERESESEREDLLILVVDSRVLGLTLPCSPVPFQVVTL